MSILSKRTFCCLSLFVLGLGGIFVVQSLFDKDAETSSTAAIIIKQDVEFDFCFIDADHSYESVLADIKAWAPKVKEGGCVIGHDIDFPSVRKAVEEVYGKSYDVLPDDIWLVRKV